MGKHSPAFRRGMSDASRALDDQTRRLVLDGLSARDGQALFESCSVLCDTA